MNRLRAVTRLSGTVAILAALAPGPPARAEQPLAVIVPDWFARQQAQRLATPHAPAIPAPASPAPASPALPRLVTPTPDARPAEAEAWGLCGPAIDEAERAEALPAGLLHAIARVETGRRHPSGAIVPWPWSVNAAGQGWFFASRAEAEAHVAGLGARGIGLVDIGCLQVNLHHHPHAFATVGAGFDPRANALYAARFLRALHARHGDWGLAAAHYHSATPARAAAYHARVAESWRRTGGALPPLPPAFPAAPSWALAATPTRVPFVVVGAPGATLRLAPALPPHATRPAAEVMRGTARASLPDAARAGLALPPPGLTPPAGAARGAPTLPTAQALRAMQAAIGTHVR